VIRRYRKRGSEGVAPAESAFMAHDENCSEVLHVIEIRITDFTGRCKHLISQGNSLISFNDKFPFRLIPASLSKEKMPLLEGIGERTSLFRVRGKRKATLVRRSTEVEAMCRKALCWQLLWW